MREIRRQLFVILSLSINHAALFMAALNGWLGLLSYLVIVISLTIIASTLLPNLMSTIISAFLSLAGGAVITIGITTAMPALFAESIESTLIGVIALIVQQIFLASLFGCLFGSLLGWIITDSLL